MQTKNVDAMHDEEGNDARQFAISRGVFYCLTATVFIFVFAPALICLVVGITHRNSECNLRAKQTVDLATWSMVTGSIGIADALMLLGGSVLSAFFIGTWKTNDGLFLVALSGICYFISRSFFLMAWFFVGIRYVSLNHKNCKDDDPLLYGIVILGLIFVLPWVFGPMLGPVMVVECNKKD